MRFSALTILAAALWGFGAPAAAFADDVYVTDDSYYSGAYLYRDANGCLSIYGTATKAGPRAQYRQITVEFEAFGLDNENHYYYATPDANGNWSLTTTAIDTGNYHVAVYFVGDDPGAPPILFSNVHVIDP